MERSQKKVVVDDLAEKFKAAAAIFIADYRGLTVGQVTQIRDELDKVQAHMQVVKNRLMKRAIDGDEFPDLMEQLRGPTAITFVSEDLVGVAKVLSKFQEEFEPLTVRAGVVKGEVIGPQQIEALSKLPSKEELYAKLLGTLMAPITNVTRVLQGNAQKLVRALASIRDSKE